MGYFWNELGKVKGASPAQFEQDQADLHNAIEDLASSRDLLRQLETAELFGGQTDGSIAQAAKGLGTHLEKLRDAALEVHNADVQAQGAIQAAQNHYDGLPQSTEPNDFERFAAMNPFVQVGSYIVSGQDFLSSVTAAREAERERQAKEALDALGDSLDQHRSLLSRVEVQPIEFSFVDEGGNWGGPVSPGDPITPVPPRGSAPPGDGMPPGSPVPPAAKVPDGGPVGAGPGPVGSVPPGGLPDADGDGVPDGVPVPDLAPGIPPAEEWPFRVYRPGDVSRDGPVDGGYSVPLNPRDGVLPRDPVWREMFAEHQREAQARAGSGLGGLATAAGVAGLAAAGGRAGLGAGARGVNLPGGVAGAGGLGPGARGVGVGGSAAGGLGSGAGGRGVGVGSGAGFPGGGSAGAGVGARGVGVGAGGVTPDGAGRAAGAGAGGAAGLRGAGAGGVGSGLGSGAAGAGSAAGAGGARGMGGVPMGGAAGGAGGSQEKDKGRRRRKYGKSGVEFFSLSDPVDPGAAAGEGGAADARLIDAPQREEGDRW